MAPFIGIKRSTSCCTRCAGCEGVDMTERIRTALLMLAVLTVLTGIVYPARDNGTRAAPLPRTSRAGASSRTGRIVGSTPDRPGVHRSPVLLGKALGDPEPPLQRGDLVGLQPRTPQPRACRGGRRRIGCSARTAGDDAGRAVPVDLVDSLRQRTRPAHQPRGGPLPGASGRARARDRRGWGPAIGSAVTSRGGSLVSSVSRA